MNHIIRQQHIHVEVIGIEADALPLPSRLSALCNSWLTPAIEEVLNRYTPTNAHLYIERLDVEAGTVLLKELERDFSTVVAQALEKALQEKTLYNQDSPLTKNVTTAESQFKTESQARFEAFLHFLKTGNLPWSFRIPQNTTLEQLLFEDLQNSSAGSMSATVQGYTDLSQLLANSAEARQRLGWQFSDGFLSILLKRLSFQREQTVDSILSKLRHSPIEPPERTLIEENLWLAAFTKISSEEFNNPNSLLTETLRILSHSIPDAIYINLFEQAKAIWPELALLKELFEDKKTALPIEISAKETPFKQIVLQSDSSKPGNARQTNILIASKDGIYIDNAGLVLLHPFLPRLFEALGISNNNQLLHSDRALCLLYFLSFGRTPPREYELALPKVLCNIPVETPVKLDVSLTEEEKDEADAMLQAVIRHWEILRNTSPDGLRSSFLLRAGKLSIRDDGDWLLRVETSSYDILLDSLPWGISMVKLPWMEQMLWVEWR